MPRKIPRVVRFTDPTTWDPPLDGSADKPDERGPSAFASTREIGWTDGSIDVERSETRYYLHGKPSDLARVNQWLAAAKMGPFMGVSPPPDLVKVPIMLEFSQRAMPNIDAVQGGHSTADIVDFVTEAVEYHLWLAEGAKAIGGPIFRAAWYRESRPEERPDWRQEEVDGAGNPVAPDGAGS